MFALENIINYTFNNKNLLFLALTHSSITNKNSKIANNERLEFLGDKVLGIIIANYLYDRFTNFPEGELSKIFSYLTSKDVLFKIGVNLNIFNFIKKNNDIPLSIVVDALEALIGAIYLDSDIKHCEQFILKHWLTYLDDYFINDIYTNFNPKSYLQEWAQKNKLSIPIYNDLKKEGPEHQPIFFVSLIVENHDEVIGKGSNKQLAQKNAALDFIHKYNLNKPTGDNKTL